MKSRKLTNLDKEAIVEIVGKIHSERILKRIYKFVLYLYTHETGS